MKKKNFLIIILAVWFSVSLGCIMSASASADTLDTVTGLEFNAVLNRLEWDVVENADSYDISVDSGTTWRTVYTNGADVYNEIKTLADATEKGSQASIEFLVKARADDHTDGSSATLTHAFTEYYGKSVDADITKLVPGLAKYPVGDEILYSELSDGSDHIKVTEGPSFNEILTLRYKNNGELTQDRVSILLMTNGSQESSNGFHFRYRARRTNPDRSEYAYGYSFMQATAGSRDLEDVFIPPLDADTVYEMKVGVLKSYDFDNDETTVPTLFMQLSYYNKVSGEKILLTDINYRPAEDVYNTALPEVDRGGTRSIVTFLDCTDAMVINNRETASMEFDANTNVLKWEAKEDADYYEWSIDNQNFKATDVNFVNVYDELLAAAQAQSALDEAEINFYVKTVYRDGSEGMHTYNYIFSEYVKDVEKFIDISSVYGFENPSDKYQSEGDRIANDVMKINERVNMGVTFSVANSRRHFFSFLHYGDRWTGNYNFAIFQNGKITYSNVAAEDVLLGQTNAISSFEIHKKYIISFGVSEIFSIGGVKKSERLLVSAYKVEQPDVTFFQVSYDNTDFADKTYKTNVFVSSKSNGYLDISPANFEREYAVTLFSGTQEIGSFMPSYQQPYHITAVPTVSAGYNHNGWYYISDGNQIDVSPDGIWYIDFKTEIDGRYSGAVFAKMEPIEYSVDYVVAAEGTLLNEVPEKYTIESTFELPYVQTNEGYVFSGWHFDPAYGDEPVTTLQGNTGDKTLYAKIIQGYKINIHIGADHHFYAIELGESFTLDEPTAPTGYTFDSWAVRETDEYVAYSGAMTFTPGKDYEFKAVFSLEEYLVTYILNEGINSTDNPNRVTTETDVKLAAAVKEGYYFDGWFVDESFKSQVFYIKDISSNLTLRARYLKDDMPKEMSFFNASSPLRLPRPDIPDYAVYTATLFEGDETGASFNVSNNEYIFDTVGEYLIKYHVTLISGDMYETTVKVYIVDRPLITVLGTYKDAYKKGDMLALFEANLTGGGSVAIELEKDGVPVVFTGNTLSLEVGRYLIIYSAPDAINIEFSFDVIDTDDNGGNPALPFIIGGAVLAVVVAAAVTTIIIIKKKKKRSA